MKIIRRTISDILFTMGVALCAAPAFAHDPSRSGIRIIFRRNDVVISLMMHISRLLKADGRSAQMSPTELDQAVRRRLYLQFGGLDLTSKTANVIGDNSNDLVTWQTTIPNPVKALEITARIYPEDPASRTLVTVMRDGRIIQEKMLDVDHPDLRDGEAKSTAGGVALRFFAEGVFHIFTGFDHVLFVLGPLLLLGSLKGLLKTVTALTVSHSITLSLGATGMFNSSPRIVEPIIALSIVAVAVENLRQSGQRSGPPEPTEPYSKKKVRDLRPLFAFGFGLVHGFGFAGAVSEVGLPK